MMRMSAVGAALAMASLSASAFDADTVGFYSFNDGAPGVSVLGGTVTNSVVGSKISAANVQLLYSPSTRDAKIQANRPGKYIFASSRAGAEIVATDPQSIHLESGVPGEGSASGEGYGSMLNFTDAGTELSKHHDTGFTIEFFMFMESGDYWVDWGHQMFLMCGYENIDKSKTLGNTKMAVCLPISNDSSYRVGFNSATSPWHGTRCDGSVADVCGSFRNAMWHHVALVERKIGDVTHFQTYVDGQRLTDCALDSTKIKVKALSSGGYFQLGRGCLTTSISCVRFTKRALDAEDFMMASDSATPVRTGDGAYAFYPFTEGTAGESAVGAAFVNQVWPGVYPGSVEVNADASLNPFAKYDADVPGRCIYDGVNGTLVCTDPKSLSVGSDASTGKGGNLTIKGVGLRASCNHAVGMTLEYFYKLDGTKCTDWTLHMAFAGGYKRYSSDSAQELRLYAPYRASAPKDGTCSLGYYSSNACRLDFTAKRAPNDGGWHHVALVETASKQIKVYYDYEYYGLYGFDSGVSLTSGGAFTFFNNALQGKISCVRFSAKPLEPEKFLRAIRETDDIVQPDVEAFYTFKDGAVGSSAAVATIYNDVNPWLYSGNVTLSTVEGAQPTAVFDTDAPGAAIYGGEEYPVTPFVTNPRSIVLDSEQTGNSGSLKIAGLAPKFYAAHGKGFTVEYFLKFLDDKVIGWDPTFLVTAGYMNGGAAANFHVSLPTDEACTYYRYGFGYESKDGLKSQPIAKSLYDGKWHHIAYVEEPVADAVRPSVTNVQITTYLDYKAAPAYLVTNFVASASEVSASGGLEICRNKHHCKISCLKVTMRPLTRRELMRTKPRGGLSVIVR